MTNQGRNLKLQTPVDNLYKDSESKHLLHIYGLIHFKHIPT